MADMPKYVRLEHLARFSYERRILDTFLLGKSLTFNMNFNGDKAGRKKAASTRQRFYLFRKTMRAYLQNQADETSSSDMDTLFGGASGGPANNLPTPPPFCPYDEISFGVDFREGIFEGEGDTFETVSPSAHIFTISRGAPLTKEIHAITDEHGNPITFPEEETHDQE